MLEKIKPKTAAATTMTKIRGLARLRRQKAISFNDLWPTLSPRLSALLAMTPTCAATLIVEDVYRLCAAEPPLHETLHAAVRGIIETHTKTVYKQLAALDGTPMLVVFVREWKRYEAG